MRFTRTLTIIGLKTNRSRTVSLFVIISTLHVIVIISTSIIFSEAHITLTQIENLLRVTYSKLKNARKDAVA